MTETATSYNVWTDTEITDRQRELLRQIDNAASGLRNSVRKVQEEASESLERMAKGQTAGWGSTIFSSCIRDAEERNTRISALILAAELMEIPQEKIQHVYTNGLY